MKPALKYEKGEESSAEAKVTEDGLCARPGDGLTVLGEAPQLHSCIAAVVKGHVTLGGCLLIVFN